MGQNLRARRGRGVALAQGAGTGSHDGSDCGSAGANAGNAAAAGQKDTVSAPIRSGGTGGVVFDFAAQFRAGGVAWLHFLRTNGFGGILADEMGLGKTLQTLAFLQFVRQQSTGGAPMLIVCPTSLVFNWVAEVKKFTPEL